MMFTDLLQNLRFRSKAAYAEPCLSGDFGAMPW